jgi:hypothetical protein
LGKLHFLGLFASSAQSGHNMDALALLRCGIVGVVPHWCCSIMVFFVGQSTINKRRNSKTPNGRMECVPTCCHFKMRPLRLRLPEQGGEIVF